MIDKIKWGVHETHCCVLHGCKYGEEDCPVENGLTEQVYACEWCDDDGIMNVKELKGFVKVKEQLREAIESGKKEVLVDVDTLELLVNR